ncbi:MAG: hypothetical protein D4R97_05170 [Bacteroidetes bacterium]|nr:MAG: hypothetical protein D4R97_05170 [Bacteroidota bacterium]
MAIACRPDLGFNHTLDVPFASFGTKNTFKVLLRFCLWGLLPCPKIFSVYRNNKAEAPSNRGFKLFDFKAAPWAGSRQLFRLNNF